MNDETNRRNDPFDHFHQKKKKNSLNNKFLVSLSFSPTNNPYVEQTRNPEKGE